MKWLIFFFFFKKKSTQFQRTTRMETLPTYRRLDFLVSSVAKENIKRCPVTGIAALLSTLHFYIVHF